MHLEVKGVTGAVPEFIITANELECARTDNLFRVIVVTNTLKRNKSHIELTGAEFVKTYGFSPVAFKAIRRKSKRA